MEQIHRYKIKILKQKMKSIAKQFLSYRYHHPRRLFSTNVVSDNDQNGQHKLKKNNEKKQKNINKTPWQSKNYTRVEDTYRYYDMIFEPTKEEGAHFHKGHPFYPRLKSFHMNEIVFHQPKFDYKTIIKSFKEEENANQLNIHQYNSILPMLPARKQLFIFDKLVRNVNNDVHSQGEATNKIISTNNSNIKPDLTMIHTIVSRLIYEGKRDMAKEFMLHNLEHVGSFDEVPEELNHLFLMNNVQLTKNRHSLIMHLIKNWRTGKAWEFFNQLRANMLARTEHYVQILSICDDAHYIKFLIDEMRENQHIVGKVNLQCYKYFTQQLLIECFDVEDVKQIISNQLEIDGYTGQEKAHKVLNLFKLTRMENWEETIKKKRIYKLKNITSQLNGSKALQYFQLFYNNRKLNKYNLTIIMRSLCSADLCLELLEKLKYYEDIIETDSIFYIPYVESLMLEGRKEEAREFVYNKLPELGIEVDEQLTKYLNFKEHALLHRRKQLLTRLRAAGREKDAVLVYEVMLDSGVQPINFKQQNMYDSMWNEFKHERNVDYSDAPRNLNILERGYGNKRNDEKSLLHKILDKFN